MNFSQLMSSMRFAITMLSFVGIASIIGTILKQKQPYESYIIKFGQFWFDIFRHLDLFNVYQAIWFLIILVFLITSTSLCVIRNSPGILRDYQKFQDKIREKSLRPFKHCYEISLPSFNKLALISLLEKNNFKVREKKNTSSDLLIVAKKGSFQKLGYIFTHLAIIIISAGGLLDGNLTLKTQELLGLKEIQSLDLPLSEIPKKSRLGSNNFSYRANVLLSEGEKQDVAVIPSKDGYLIQELPFSVGLKDFNIEHYSSGQPKSFESDLVLKSKITGKTKEQKIILTTGCVQNIAKKLINKKYKNYSLYSMPIWGMKSKPTVKNIVKNFKEIITVEDHFYDGGFGSWLQESINNTKIKTIIESKYITINVVGEVGSKEYLLKNYGPR